VGCRHPERDFLETLRFQDEIDAKIFVTASTDEDLVAAL